MEAQLTGPSNVARIRLCPQAPKQLGAVFVNDEDECPYCQAPLAEHEEFLKLKKPDPKQEPNDRVSQQDAVQAIDLLRRWWLRWSGGAPDQTVPYATRDLLRRYGRDPGAKE